MFDVSSHGIHSIHGLGILFLHLPIEINEKHREIPMYQDHGVLGPGSRCAPLQNHGARSLGGLGFQSWKLGPGRLLFHLGGRGVVQARIAGIRSPVDLCKLWHVYIYICWESMRIPWESMDDFYSDHQGYLIYVGDSIGQIMWKCCDIVWWTTIRLSWEFCCAIGFKLMNDGHVTV